MNFLHAITHLKGTLKHGILILVIWLFSLQNVVALNAAVEQSHFSSFSELVDLPKSGVFNPIEISPAAIPQIPFPGESSVPVYPTLQPTYDPVLSGKCPVNFSAISSIINKTASDCFQPVARVLGNVICCPQFSSFLHIFQGYYSNSFDKLVLPNETANDCFSDIISILTSRGANQTLSTICSVKSTNLTGGSCPVTDVITFEKTINTSKLLEACSTVDPLRECCRPICQPAIMEAALQISTGHSPVDDNKNIIGEPSHFDILNDCKGVVYAWLSRKLPQDAANSAFRILSACKVNKVCPLEFRQPSEVINACRNLRASSQSCCSSLNTYIGAMQNQMLLTNRQAIVCATMFGSMLRRGGITTSIYELCEVDLKDFSIQVTNGQPVMGCLLRSLPADVIFDNTTGYGFTCDLSDNIAAPWPSSSSMTSLSLCAPEMSLPALPTSESQRIPGCCGGRFEVLVPIFSFLAFSTFFC